MTLHVVSPIQDGSRLSKRTERLNANYQRGGAQYSGLQYLVDGHPESIYFSDDPEADFGQDDYEAYLEYHQRAYGSTKDAPTRAQFLYVREFFTEERGL